MTLARVVGEVVTARSASLNFPGWDLCRPAFLSTWLSLLGTNWHMGSTYRAIANSQRPRTIFSVWQYRIWSAPCVVAQDHFLCIDQVGGTKAFASLGGACPNRDRWSQ